MLGCKSCPVATQAQREKGPPPPTHTTCLQKEKALIDDVTAAGAAAFISDTPGDPDREDVVPSTSSEVDDEGVCLCVGVFFYN